MVYIQVPKGGDDGSLQLMISYNPVRMPQVTFVLHDHTIYLPPYLP